MIFIDSVQSDPLPSSFVKRALKFYGDTGHGEAKLYLRSDYSLQYCVNFFNNYDQSNRYFFIRNSLINYLFNPNIINEYHSAFRYKGVSNQYRINMINSISSFPDIIELFFEERLALDNEGRYYIRSWDDIFRQAFRSSVLPLTAHLELLKFQFDGNYDNCQFLSHIPLQLNSYVYIVNVVQ